MADKLNDAKLDMGQDQWLEKDEEIRLHDPDVPGQMVAYKVLVDSFNITEEMRSLGLELDTNQLDGAEVNLLFEHLMKKGYMRSLGVVKDTE